MNHSVNNLMARLGLLGVEHCHHDEAMSIAQWLAREPATREAASAIRIASLMGQGRCEEALVEGNEAPWPSLGPWLALCERQLGYMAALERRLERMALSEDPDLVRFAQGMRAQVVA
ncbi:YscG family type III secretion system chaperone [Pseudomonas mosselii]|uniref:YscG family type III secretion system chaperone n=1 Tax=Pseudomonas mosselii TaxID=78327 RepID=UPI000BB48105|nr:YscG family type III secretion system chaperone [Pseudomonas mosselii]ATB63737.1 YscG family type III secretion protein [Pseudomonas mosselii]MDH1099748.1 YscG family type III secretion system chaperone [Pseudomonas mosselii]MEA3233061.1 YscG family type III secretion system chaperone [Pseudomonas mosselii]MEB5934196.1 YscG family type III secretion system chaperone [Pseudomonas mosselii]UVN46068.1 YscG family type III secretion system chaperone [Pseudomonas mosselii]